MNNAFKMLLATVAVLALSSTAAFAEIGVSGWGRGLFVPAATHYDGEDAEVVPQDGTSWGGNTRLGFTVAGNSDKVGFQMDIYSDGGEVTGGDQGKIWAKPIDIVTVELGYSIFYDALRGNANGASWDWLRFAGMNGEDDIFDRGNAGSKQNDSHGTVGNAGALVHLDTNGLHAFAGFDIVEAGYELAMDSDGDGTNDTQNQTTVDMLAHGQYGVGYEIAGLGMARAQYIGKYYAEAGEEEVTSYGVINAAFKVDKAVPNLYLDLGVWMATDGDNTNGDYTTVVLFASYTMGTIKPYFIADVSLENADGDGEDGTGMQFAVGTTVDLGSGLGVDTEVRYINSYAATSTEDAIGVLAGVKQGFSNGLIGIAFEGTTGNFAGTGGAGGWDGLGKENVDDFVWAIPVKAEYWF